MMFCFFLQAMQSRQVQSSSFCRYVLDTATNVHFVFPRMLREELLRKSRLTFVFSLSLCVLQDRVCASLPGLPPCRDCRDDVGQKTGLECCRFNSFRR